MNALRMQVNDMQRRSVFWHTVTVLGSSVIQESSARSATLLKAHRRS